MSARPEFVERILAPLSPETRAMTERFAEKYLAGKGGIFLEDEDAVRRVWEVCRDQALDDDVRAELVGPGSDGQAGAPGDWPSPKPLTESELLEFPVESLPSPLREFVEEVSRALQTSPALAAMCCLAVCAAAVAKKFEVKIRPSWEPLPLNQYIVVVLPSGDRKSSVYSVATRPMRDYELKLVENTRDTIADERTRLGVLKGRQDHLRKEAAKAKTEVDRRKLLKEAQDVGRELAAAIEPADPLLILDDATPQSIETTLMEQGGKIAVLSDEATPFDAAANFVGKNAKPHITVFLKAHDGGDIRVTRQGRTPVFVTKPALTICVTCQPDALTELLETFTRRGFLNRVLFAVPRSNIGHRVTDPPPDPAPHAVIQNYADAVTRLLELEAATEPLTLSPEAHALFVKCETQIEALLGDACPLSHLTGWGEKLKGMVARIAAVFHLVVRREEPRPGSTPIDRDTMWRAVSLVDFFVAHALRAFDEIGAFPKTALARRILEWIKRNRLEEFAQSKLHHDNEHLVRTPEQWNEPLGLLVECGYLKLKDQPAQKGPGARRLPSYVVNPEVLREGGAT